MVRTVPAEQMQSEREESAEERVRRLQREIAAANPDLTDDDWDALAEQWTGAVNEGLRERVRRSRSERE